MSDETLEPPLPPIDARTEAVAERLFGLKFALRKDDPKHIHANGSMRPTGSTTDTCVKPSKCSPSATKRNLRAPTDPITGSGCASNTVS